MQYDDRSRNDHDASGAHGRHHRPLQFADLTSMIDASGGVVASSREELAAATADAVVRAGRGRGTGDSEVRFVELADQVGLDTLAALWRDADPVSLPGALWTLYVLRQWSRSDADEVTRLWRLGEPYAPADAVVAGVADTADSTDASAVRDLADAVLAGAYEGDFAVALERAAAFFRVVAAGRRALLDSGDHPDQGLAERNDRAAAALSAAARKWRAGTLR